MLANAQALPKTVLPDGAAQSPRATSGLEVRNPYGAIELGAPRPLSVCDGQVQHTS
jgi:hypothetical protein